ncbi:MAG: hypothetical protein JWP81_2230 [Ferruginibacter sp.]|nr:hypothetical protein [Ferruginibacter sp.]
MEQDQLKSAWNNLGGENKKKEELKKMISENRHPVLKGIRLQMIIEMVAWIFFLVFYYDMFDGEQKPFYLNILLVTAVLLLLTHSFLGYLSAKKPVNGNDLKQSLVNYLAKIRRYALISVASRAFSFVCLLFFFTATISFTTQKYWLLGIILVILGLQVFFLSRIWGSRIKKIQLVVKGLNE